VEITEGITGTFDVVAARDERRTPVGTLTVLANNMVDKRHKPVTLVLDISKAATDLLATQKPAGIRLIARHAADKNARPFSLRAQSAQIRLERRKAKSQT
jgi:hypothetical protein